MFDIYKQNISIEKLRKDELVIEIPKNSSDLISYPEFLKYFADLQEINKHNLIIGINFTYGWMPTIFDFRSNKFDEAVKVLNSAKRGQKPTESESRILWGCFNRSLVGTSKLLHFINPTLFAIWDSRVYRYLTNKEPHSYRLDNYNSYLDFLKFCDFITNEQGFDKIHKSMAEKIGYSITPFRAVELVMYLTQSRRK